jgi:hypothetical protein
MEVVVEQVIGTLEPSPIRVIEIDWEMLITTYMGGLRGQPVPEGDYLLWVERSWDAPGGGYVRGSNTRTRITVDKTQPTTSEPRMYVSRDGEPYKLSSFVIPGDMVKIQAEAKDTPSGVDRVEFRIQDKETGEYLAPRVFKTSPITGNNFRRIYAIILLGKSL